MLLHCQRYKMQWRRSKQQRLCSRQELRFNKGSVDQRHFHQQCLVILNGGYWKIVTHVIVV
jgi:hypothetical protein